ncbi:hypothetical protein NUU61_009744 [Penicillium alfredii]|uniref:EXPERA domain-containing protein n=1 Tax=Penicillium alfredii TaxID=1506179 RepID=A0A9W9JTW3_9EURO|nr:uncharacterized protein NUU61_009744 [Penicillium alfredii]KAJ5081480.1 hypothetical protein NUU61_009744 [Penicillium alfredii]
MSSPIGLPVHPYYPLNLEIGGYLANEWKSWDLVSIFVTGCTIIFLASYLLVMRVQPKISTNDLLTLKWFALCGCIHLFFEGYYVYNFRHMPGMQDLFGQLWKEYSLSDSRYLSQDAFVLCMEVVTAVCWGPLSFALAFMITTQHPLRYPLQVVVSLGQLYGNVLYYGTCLFDHYIFDVSYSRPEASVFWGYFVFLNAFWIVIPSLLVYTSLSMGKRAFEALAKSEESLRQTDSASKIAKSE